MFEPPPDPELPDDTMSPQELAAWVASDAGGPDPDVEMSAEIIRQAPSLATVAAMQRLLVDTDGVVRPAADLSDAQVIDLVVAAGATSAATAGRT